MTGKRVCEKHQQAYETACPWCEPPVLLDTTQRPAPPRHDVVFTDLGGPGIRQRLGSREWATQCTPAQQFVALHTRAVNGDYCTFCGKTGTEIAQNPKAPCTQGNPSAGPYVLPPEPVAGYSGIGKDGVRFWRSGLSTQPAKAADIIADMNRLWGKLAEEEERRRPSFEELQTFYGKSTYAPVIISQAALDAAEPEEEQQQVRDPHDVEWTAKSLGEALAAAPAGYAILLCADDCLPPSPWTDHFRVEVDHAHKVVRLCGSFT